MAKHKSVAISGDDLLARVEHDSDTPWRNVIGWNCEKLDKLEAIDDPTPEQESERHDLEAQQVAEVATKWWVVQWPNHVLTPRFNSDASYSWCENKSEARGESELAYNE